MKHTKLNQYLDDSKKCIDISMYDQAAISLRKCVDYMAGQLCLAFAGDTVSPDMSLHEKLIALKGIDSPVLTRQQFDVLFQIKSCGNSAAHSDQDNSYRTISGSAEGPTPAEVMASYYNLQALLPAFYAKVPVPLNESAPAKSWHVQRSAAGRQHDPFNLQVKATAPGTIVDPNKADTDYGILVPCKGSLKGNVSYLIRKGTSLPAKSDSITLYSTSGVIALRLYRSGYGRDAGSSDPDDCEELIRAPFTVPANSRCHVSLRMETGRKILIDCRTEDGAVATKCYG